MPPQGGLVVDGGASQCFTFQFPSRVIISKIVVIQTGGVVGDFTAALFNHIDACEGHPLSESDTFTEPSMGVLDPDVYRVTPDIQGTAGRLVYFSDAGSGGHGYVFYSQETLKESQLKRIGNVRRIHLRITPGGSGPKTFCAAIGGLIAVD
jgi:hypothetical protein